MLGRVVQPPPAPSVVEQSRACTIDGRVVLRGGSSGGAGGGGGGGGITRHAPVTVSLIARTSPASSARL